MIFSRITRRDVLCTLAVLLAAGTVSPVSAQPHRGHDNGNHRGHYQRDVHHDNRRGYYNGGYYAAPPVVYEQPVPAYYQPPPVVYQEPRDSGLNINLNLR